jgi:hypothetical protein
VPFLASTSVIHKKYVNSTKEKSSKKENTYDDNDDMYILNAFASLKACRREEKRSFIHTFFRRSETFGSGGERKLFGLVFLLPFDKLRDLL